MRASLGDELPPVPLVGLPYSLSIDVQYNMPRALPQKRGDGSRNMRSRISETSA
jgi:hypothetical protein